MATPNNLLGALQQRPEAPSATGNLRSLLRARSGSALGGPAVAGSNLGEQQALVSSQQEIANRVTPGVATQQIAQEQQQAGIQQSEQIAQQTEAQKRRELSVRERIQTDAILADLESGKLQLAGKQDVAKLEQLGANLRLENRGYIENLQREGARNRLDSELGFQGALQKAALGNSAELLRKQIAGKDLLAANDREYRRALSRMGIDDARALFREERKAERERSEWEGIGSTMKAGIGAAGTYYEGQQKKEYYTEGPGASEKSFEAYSYQKDTAEG